MGRVFEQYVDSARVFSCAKCRAHLSRSEDIISKVRSTHKSRGTLGYTKSDNTPQNFQGTSGKAYLFDDAYVASSLAPVRPPEERVLMTGLHIVLDLYCNTCSLTPRLFSCSQKEAHEASEKYKEGKFILELAKTDQSP
ncbi:hypothetical protein BBJ28_00007705 [Nothophytophthora sp. Chile5]|nr:hypothetical protein BBJ28_00007705 [Nothophytophthora sp. Chile5]